MVIKIGPRLAPGVAGLATAIVVNYHAGIRYYTLIATGEFAACETATQEDQADLVLGQPE